MKFLGLNCHSCYFSFGSIRLSEGYAVMFYSTLSFIYLELCHGLIYLRSFHMFFLYLDVLPFFLHKDGPFSSFRFQLKWQFLRKDYLEYLIKNTSPLLRFLFIPELLLPQYRKHFVIIYLFTCVPLVYNFMKKGITPVLFISVWVAFSTGTW